ncbi:glutamate--tRNA ligase [Candidatus Woesearchaeota archaeon]|nr:glutamate--tRNA ligase [Candidatus Woesearchaeota archaeon]
MKDIVLKWVLQNAHKFGKINSKFVLGMVLREKAELRKKVPAVMKEIEKAIDEVSKLDKGEIKKKLGKLAPELLKEKKEKKEEGPLKSLPGAAKGKVVVRIAPSPSGPMHIGHAYGVSLNYEYAKMYSGELILRIEDTNPDNIYPAAYELIEDDAKWLTDGGVAQVVVQSSRLGIYYDAAEKLVGLGKAYVCECDVDKWRVMKSKGEACPCRKLKVKENQLRYAKMFNGYAEGEAVLKLKTDIKHKNPAMRDFSIMRINEHVHPKTGKEQRVWPLMVFSVAIDDHDLGMTHVLNGKDHADNGKKESLIMEYLSWKAPEYKHWGRINFEGMKLSTSQTKVSIEQGEYTGWDDIRLATLMALRRRGYQAGAFRKYALEIGLSLNDKTVSREEFWKNINAFNREIVESKANRYFFVDEPKKITLVGGKKKSVEIGLHPNFPKRGVRKLKAGKDFYIAKKDFDLLEKGKIHRLMDCCNFEVSGEEFKFVSESYEDYRGAKNKGAIIHWLPSGDKLKVEVVMEDGGVVSGIGEKGLEELKEGKIVQLERRYFARLDKKSKGKLTFWFLHK